MKVRSYKDVTETEVEMEGAVGARMRLLISEKDGAENFAMRMFSVAPGGHTPFHFHDYEHEVFVLEGKGRLKGEDSEHSFSSGDVIFVQANEPHQFVNSGCEPLRFLCLIPSTQKCG